MKTSLLFALTFASSTYAAECVRGNPQQTFDLCESNALGSSPDVLSVCSSLAPNSAEYFDCLCRTGLSYSNCFEQYCSGAVEFPTVRANADGFCASSRENPFNGTRRVGPTNVGTPTNPQIPPSSTETETSRLNDSNSAMMTSASAIVGVLTVFSAVMLL